MRQYIPFRVVELEPNSYHILVNANINNTPVVLIVDSGASRTVIDKIYGAHISRTGLYLALEPWANGKSAGTACKNSPTAAELVPMFFSGSRPPNGEQPWTNEANGR